ncbi:hypothetical protein AB1N83_001040 [Pleurotus pulmonarius]
MDTTKIIKEVSTSSLALSTISLASIPFVATRLLHNLPCMDQRKGLLDLIKKTSSLTCSHLSCRHHHDRAQLS